MCSSKSWITIGAIMAGLAVITGAFAAHGLDAYCTTKYAHTPPKTVAGFTIPAAWQYLQDFKTGARYQMYHALGLIAVGLLSLQRQRKSLQVAGFCFLFGILFFSGSLYALVLTGETKWGAITPIGGTLMIVGWFAFAVAACPCRKKEESDPASESVP